jgi:4-hydroxymandelate oxidase
MSQRRKSPRARAGRPLATTALPQASVLHGLATGGATGVAHVLRLLRDELEIAMALCGCRTLEQISPLHLHN